VTAERFLPWSGPAAFMMVVASFGVGGTVPAADAPVSDVVSFYSANTATQTASGVLLGGAALLFLVFAAWFASELRRRDERAAVSAALVLLGAGMVAVALSLFGGFSVAAADLVGHVDDATLNMLNVLSQEAAFVFVVTVGTAAFMFGAGSGVLITAIAPRWLGWVAIVLGIVATIPSHVLGALLDHIGFAAFFGLAVWCAVVGVMLAIRPQQSPARANSG
jgi:MFS family permease